MWNRGMDDKANSGWRCTGDCRSGGKLRSVCTDGVVGAGDNIDGDDTAATRDAAC